MQLPKSIRKKKWWAILTPVVSILAYFAELILPSLFSSNAPPKVDQPPPPVNYFFEDNSFTDNSVNDHSFTDNSVNDHSFTDNSVNNHSFTDNSVKDYSVNNYSLPDNSVKDYSVNDSFNKYLLNEKSVNDSFQENSFNFPFRITNRNDTQVDSLNRSESQFIFANAAKVEIPVCLCCDSVKVKDNEKKQIYEVTVAPGGSKYWAEYPEAAYW